MVGVLVVYRVLAACRAIIVCTMLCASVTSCVLYVTSVFMLLLNVRRRVVVVLRVLSVLRKMTVFVHHIRHTLQHAYIRASALLVVRTSGRLQGRRAPVSTRETV